jgi:ribosomal protein S14
MTLDENYRDGPARNGEPGLLDESRCARCGRHWCVWRAEWLSTEGVARMALRGLAVIGAAVGGIILGVTAKVLLERAGCDLWVQWAGGLVFGVVTGFGILFGGE